jgi:hypothetical protein
LQGVHSIAFGSRSLARFAARLHDRPVLLVGDLSPDSGVRPEASEWTTSYQFKAFDDDFGDFPGRALILEGRRMRRPQARNPVFRAAQ